MYGRETAETDHGFIIYKFFEAEKLLYIHSIYVEPQYRKLGFAKKMEDALIEKYKPAKCLCYVDLETRDPELSLLTILAAGYKIVNTDNLKIVLSKQIR